MWVWHQLACTVVLLVDFTLWTILYPHSTPGAKAELRGFYSVNEHAINFALMFVEFWLSRIPFEKRHTALIVIWPLCWVSFQWLYYYGANEAQWMYFFMECACPL